MILKVKVKKKTCQLDTRDYPDHVYFEALALGFEALIRSGKLETELKDEKVMLKSRAA